MPKAKTIKKQSGKKNKTSKQPNNQIKTNNLTAVFSLRFFVGQVYGKKSIAKEYKDEIRNRYDSFDNYNAFIVRGNNFAQKGRVHNLEESKQLDADVLQMLSDNKIFHGYYKQGNLSEAVENIEKWLDKDKVSTIANEAEIIDKNALNEPTKEKPKKIKEKINDR